MSDTTSQGNAALFQIRRLTQKFDEQGTQIKDFMSNQAHGENPDPELFSRLLEQREVTRIAMQTQFKLHEKPLKTVMNEVK